MKNGDARPKARGKKRRNYAMPKFSSPEVQTAFLHAFTVLGLFKLLEGLEKRLTKVKAEKLRSAKAALGFELAKEVKELHWMAAIAGVTLYRPCVHKAR